jgi:hypothetical protein
MDGDFLGGRGGDDLDCGDANGPLCSNLSDVVCLAGVSNTLLVSTELFSNDTGAVAVEFGPTITDTVSRDCITGDDDKDAFIFPRSKLASATLFE